MKKIDKKIKELEEKYDVKITGIYELFYHSFKVKIGTEIKEFNYTGSTLNYLEKYFEKDLLSKLYEIMKEQKEKEDDVSKTKANKSIKQK